MSLRFLAAAPGIAVTRQCHPYNPAPSNQYQIQIQCLIPRQFRSLHINRPPALVILDFPFSKTTTIKRISDFLQRPSFPRRVLQHHHHTNFSPPLDKLNVFDSTGHPVGDAGLIHFPPKQPPAKSNSLEFSGSPALRGFRSDILRLFSFGFSP